MESWTASLHAGLIQRTRPPAQGKVAQGKVAQEKVAQDKVVPLREREPYGRAPAAPQRESAIARARAGMSRAPERDNAQMPELPGRLAAPSSLHPARHALQVGEARNGDARAGAGWSFRRRFGLTVRVRTGLRELLLDARMRTGRTTQSILHDALVQYLLRVDREQDPR